MKSLFRKALTSIALFSVSAAMLAVNYNQAYAVPGYEEIGFGFARNSDRTFQQIVCPTSDEHGVDGNFFVRRGIDSRQGPLNYGQLDLVEYNLDSKANPDNNTRVIVRADNTI